MTTHAFLGSNAPDPDAHIIESDATGYPDLFGLHVTNNVDGPNVVDVTSVNTLIPAVYVECLAGASAVQSTVGTASAACLDAVVGAGTGFQGDCLRAADVGVPYLSQVLGQSNQGLAAATVAGEVKARTPGVAGIVAVAVQGIDPTSRVLSWSASLLRKDGNETIVCAHAGLRTHPHPRSPAVLAVDTGQIGREDARRLQAPSCKTRILEPSS